MYTIYLDIIRKIVEINQDRSLYTIPYSRRGHYWPNANQLKFRDYEVPLIKRL